MNEDECIPCLKCKTGWANKIEKPNKYQCEDCEEIFIANTMSVEEFIRKNTQ